MKTILKNSLLLFLMSIIIVGFSSCEKDENDSPDPNDSEKEGDRKTLIASQDWVLKNYKVVKLLGDKEEEVTISSIKDLFFPPCKRDNTLKFYDDGSIVSVFEGVKCEDESGNSEKSNYVYDEASKTLTLQVLGKVLSDNVIVKGLTDTKLSLFKEHEAEAGVGTTKTFRLYIDYEPK